MADRVLEKKKIKENYQQITIFTDSRAALMAIETNCN
jgi:hypothetical protein